jgi:predicted small lipoprotein YifL
MLGLAKRVSVVVAAIALLGGAIAGCGSVGPTLPSPDGGGPVASQVQADMGPSLHLAQVPCPVPVADLTLYEAPDVASGADAAEEPGTWVARPITSWEDNRYCGGGGESARQIGGEAIVTWTTTLSPGDNVWVKLVYKEGTADEVTIGPVMTEVPES